MVQSILQARWGRVPSIRWTFVCTLVLAAALGSSDAVAQTTDFAGVYQGTWNSDFGSSGGLSTSLSQSGISITGSLTIRSTDCGDFIGLPLTGTVSSARVSFDASAVCAADGSFNVLRFTNGVLLGNQLSGRYTIFSDGQFFDSGSFQLTRTVNIIRTSAGSGGSISPGGDVSVSAGSNLTLAISANDGFKVSDVIVDGTSVGQVTSYTFQNISTNHTIVATFSESANVPAALVPIITLILDE